MKRVTILFIIVSLLLGSYLGYINYNSKEDMIVKDNSGSKDSFISYTLNGNATNLSYDELISEHLVDTITCQKGSIANWDSARNGIYFSKVIMGDSCIINFKEVPQFISKILSDNGTISERTDFSVINVANTTGSIYKTNKTEDGSYVYYYSGNTTNNWVYFGGFYWRIIRTNIDGSVRLLYAGTNINTTSGYIGTSTFNNDYNESKHVGYMYGGTSSLADNRANTTSSTIKGVIDTWYQNNLLESYDKYISKSAIYCNDRSIGEGTWSNNSSRFYYGARVRLNSNKTPNYKCGANTTGGLFESTQATADKFSVSTTGGGNGQLTYPIALMTADEIAFAGGVYNIQLTSPYTYYYNNATGASITGVNGWWTLSPSYTNSATSLGWRVYGSETGYSGLLNSGYINVSLAIRPVISILPCAKVTGSGTSAIPYQIDETNSTC